MGRSALPVLLLALAAVAAPAAAGTGPASEAGVRVRWLGVAGFEIASGDTTILHDPYLSRPGMLRTLFTRYRPDEEHLEALLAPGGPLESLAGADAILIGHGHFDHLGDAPWLASRTGAVLYGSRTATNVALGYGLDAAQVRVTVPGDTLEIPPFEVRVVESRHALLGDDEPPLQGTVDEPPDGPIHAFSMKLGDARGYLVTHVPSGQRIYLLSSANREPAALAALSEQLGEGGRVDLLLVASQGGDDAFAGDLVRALRPRVAIPHHFERFFLGLDDPRASEPRDEEALAAFEQQLRDAASASGLDLVVRRPELFAPFALGE